MKLIHKVQMLGGMLVLCLFWIGVYLFWAYMTLIIIMIGAILTIGGIIAFTIWVGHSVHPFIEARHRRKLEREAQEHQHAIDRRAMALDESKHLAQVTATLAAFQHQQYLDRTRVTPDTYVMHPEGGYIYLPKQQVPRLPAPKKDTDESNDDTQPVLLPPPVDVADLLQSKQWIPSKTHLFLAMTAEGPLSVAYKG
jgi:hypothetical protein